MARNADGRLELMVSAGATIAIHTQLSPNVPDSWSATKTPSMGSIRTHGEPTALTNTDGLVEVVAHADGRFFVWSKQTAKNSATYTAWVPVGTDGGVRADGERVALGRNTDGRLELFFLGRDSSILEKWENTPGQNDWAGGTVRNGFLKALAMGTNNDGRLEVFGTTRPSGSPAASPAGPTGPRWIRTRVGESHAPVGVVGRHGSRRCVQRGHTAESYQLLRR